MENKNTLVALVLMLVVWTGFTFLFPPAEKPVEQSTTQTTSEISNSADSVVSSDDIDVLPTVPNQDNSRYITVENDVYSAVFSEVTASLVDLKLKKYKESTSSESEYVSLLDINKKINSLVLSGSKDFSVIGEATYKVSENSDNIIVNKEKFEISFISVVDKIQIIKKFVFYQDKYDFDCNIELKNISDASINGKVILSLSNFWSEETKGNRLEFVGPVYFSEDELTTVDVEDINSDVSSQVIWSGYENKYFLSAIIGQDKFTNLALKHYNNTVQSSYITSDLNIDSGSEFITSSRIFYGPKDVEILKSVDSNLAKVVDFGFFKIIAKPLHLVLNFFYGYIGNYGFSIILLTVIIKLLFWPLTQKSYVSMKAMQKLQPEMKKLREKYSNDRESLNRKMMELYREHRVNPLGGCLPMLVQIPVFFALYKVLLGTIELRHAPFIFWLTDLSVKDPYYITPLIMGVTMFIQQKLTPNTMDPMQAKMMLAMPVVFTFLFLNFPAGLVVYWLVNNLLTIFQQYLIYKKPA